MLNFKNTNIIFTCMLVVVLVLKLWVGLPWYYFLLIFFVYSLILFYGCYYVGSNFFIKIICSSNTTAKEIAISFDDGPAKNYTPQIIEILKAQKVEAAFFCIGNRLKGNENIVKQIIAGGHIIGNHSHSHHFWFDMFSAKKMEQDLALMDEEFKNITGLQPKLFRPPYGVTNPNLKKAILNRGYTTVGWSMRSMDTVDQDKEKFFKKIIGSLHPGAIFLFHDTSILTAGVLAEFIAEVKNSGYRIVRLDKLLQINAYA